MSNGPSTPNVCLMQKECVPPKRTIILAIRPQTAVTYILQVKQESYTWELANLALCPLG